MGTGDVGHDNAIQQEPRLEEDILPQPEYRTCEGDDGQDDCGTEVNGGEKAPRKEDSRQYEILSWRAPPYGQAHG